MCVCAVFGNLPGQRGCTLPLPPCMLLAALLTLASQCHCSAVLCCLGFDRCPKSRTLQSSSFLSMVEIPFLTHAESEKRERPVLVSRWWPRVVGLESFCSGYRLHSRNNLWHEMAAGCPAFSTMLQLARKREGLKRPVSSHENILWEWHVLFFIGPLPKLQVFGNYGPI